MGYAKIVDISGLNGCRNCFAIYIRYKCLDDPSLIGPTVKVECLMWNQLKFQNDL